MTIKSGRGYCPYWVNSSSDYHWIKSSISGLTIFTDDRRFFTQGLTIRVDVLSILGLIEKVNK